MKDQHRLILGGIKHEVIHSHDEAAETTRGPSFFPTFRPSQNEPESLVILLLQHDRLFVDNAVAVEKIPRITTVITAYHPHHRNRCASGVMLHPDRRRLSGINHFCDEESDVTRVVTVEKSSPPALSVGIRDDSCQCNSILQKTLKEYKPLLHLVRMKAHFT